MGIDEQKPEFIKLDIVIRGDKHVNDSKYPRMELHIEINSDRKNEQFANMKRLIEALNING